MSKKHFLIILSILFCIFVLVPSLVVYKKVFSEWIYLFFYYLIGAYIKLFMDDIEDKYKFLMGAIIFYLGIVGFSFYIQYLSNFNKVLLGLMYSFTQIRSVLIFISAICLFMFFKNLKMKEYKLINKLSNFSFGVYLFHEHTYMRRFLWFELIDLNVFVDSPYFIFISIFIIVVVYLIGGMYEWVRQVIFKHIELFLCNLKNIKRCR